MSLFGALSASLTALTAQSTATNVISNNIANLDTNGFKATNTSFSNLVTGQVGGGVLQSIRTDVSAQGAVESTGVGTDLAIQGSGFFAVTDLAENTLFTRAGSFRTDSNGRLVNESGYVLQGWPLDSEGRLPGESGNVNTTSNQDLESLVDISTSSITGTASPTSAITAKINLRAEETVLQGAGATFTFPSTSVNSGITSTQIIVPTGNMATGDLLTITPGGSASLPGTSAVAVSYEYGGFAASDNISTTIGGVTNANSTFTAFTDGDDFTIDVDGDSTFDAVTFTFQTTANTDNNEFSTLSELAQVINSVAGLTSRVSGGILYIAPDDANNGLTFTDGGGGIVADAGLVDVAADTDNNRFATLDNLSTLVNTSADFEAQISNPTASATIFVYNVDPTDTVTFTDDVTGDDLLNEFGFTDAEILAGDNAVSAVYDPSATSTLKTMASGNISADFSRTITIFTSLGESLDLRLAFVKIQDETSPGQTWAVELFAPDANDVVTGRADGLITSGIISFNGDGSFNSVSTSLSNAITIQPSGGATSQDVTLSLGTPGDVGTGDTSGLSQFAGQYSVDELSQNGFPTGQLQSLQIDSQGFVTAIFDNSLTSQVYKLPLAFFSNPNGLTPESGNAYSSNADAGEVTLGQVGDASVGTIVPSALEVSTAEIGNELTKLIVVQQAYSASANVLRQVSRLFDELKNLNN